MSSHPTIPQRICSLTSLQRYLVVSQVHQTSSQSNSTLPPAAATNILYFLLADRILVSIYYPSCSRKNVCRTGALVPIFFTVTSSRYQYISSSSCQSELILPRLPQPDQEVCQGSSVQHHHSINQRSYSFALNLRRPLPVKSNIGSMSRQLSSCIRH